MNTTNSNSNSSVLTAQEKEVVKGLVDRFGGWANIINALQNIEAKNADDVSEETRQCRLAAEKLNIDWRMLANQVIKMLADIKVQPNLWNASSILQLSINYGLNPMCNGEIHCIRFNNSYQAIIGVNGIYRLVANDPRFVSVRFEYGENIIVAEKNLPSGIKIPQTAPNWCKCVLTVKKGDNTFDCEKIKWLSDCYRDSPAWRSSPAEMLAARAYWSIARCALGLGIGDEGAPEDPHWTSDKAPAPSPAKPATQPQQVQVVQVSDELEDIL